MQPSLRAEPGGQHLWSAPRVRFAPSPTGFLHVGGARTALFNWLFARHHGGVLVLRVEDTDLERSTPEMVEGILEGMRWLGLDWDEGPFFQTQRSESYRVRAAQLVSSGAAYYCFCRKDDLARLRQEAIAAGRTPKYEGSCRTISPEQARRRLQAGEPAAVRFAVPPAGSTGFEDAVFGPVAFANEELEDFVLLRSDGAPTYHLSVVADDVEMRISHVIRGADHISNTPKQVLLYRALNEPLPVFAHLPLILGADRTRLSKRHGATSVMAYREQGIVPEAFRNYLALLGWTPSEGTPEILNDEELIGGFGLAGISRSNAVFDRAKLDWFNTEYIRRYPPDRLLPLIEQEWSRAGFRPEQRSPESLLATVRLLQPRARSLRDFGTSFGAFFSAEVVPDAGAVKKFLADSNVTRMLTELAERYAALGGEFDEQQTESALRELAAEKGVKAGVLINGARVALTGQGVAPSLFSVMVLLGKRTSIDRLKSSAALRAKVDEGLGEGA